MIVRVAWVLLGYLAGSVSFAYLAGRLVRGIDLRRYGTHTLGGSNVFHHVSRPGIVIVGLLDILKAALPTWLGVRLNLGLPTALGSGIAALLGHNWSLFLSFKGGRGVSTCMGVLAPVFPWGFVWILGFLALGRLVKSVALLCLMGFLTLPFFAWAMDSPVEIVTACMIMTLIIVLKRLEANREPLPEGKERVVTLWRRFLHDRDIADADAWRARVPSS